MIFGFLSSRLLACLFGVWYTLKDRSSREVKFLAAAAFGVLLQFAATAKYFSFHYLVPGFGLSGLVFVLFIYS